MRFDLAPHTLVFNAGGQYPALFEDEIFQIQDRTAGGQLQVETLGISVRTRELTFSLMGKVDYYGLRDWFYNVTNAGEKTFVFTDEYGDVGNVVFLGSKLSFQETSLDVWAGSITLEYVG